MTKRWVITYVVYHAGCAEFVRFKTETINGSPLDFIEAFNTLSDAYPLARGRAALIAAWKESDLQGGASW